MTDWRDRYPNGPERLGDYLVPHTCYVCGTSWDRPFTPMMARAARSNVRICDPCAAREEIEVEEFDRYSITHLIVMDWCGLVENSFGYCIYDGLKEGRDPRKEDRMLERAVLLKVNP